MAGNLVTFTAGNWADEVEKSQTPVLVDFWAVWCGPCRMIAPIIEELSTEYGSHVKVGKLNVDDNQTIAAKFGVMSIPTVMLFKNGEPVERVVGLVPKRELKSRIDAKVG